MNDQPPNVAVAALADAQKGLLAPGRMLCRNETQPRGEIARLAELPNHPAAATIAVAPSAPIPGIVTRRLTASCWLA